jgi:hypothetical protein
MVILGEKAARCLSLMCLMMLNEIDSLTAGFQGKQDDPFDTLGDFNFLEATTVHVTNPDAPRHCHSLTALLSHLF